MTKQINKHLFDLMVELEIIKLIAYGLGDMNGILVERSII